MNRNTAKYIFLIIISIIAFNISAMKFSIELLDSLAYDTINIAYIKKLIDKGADVNISDIHGWTPLYHAIIKENIELIKLLLDSNADIKLKDKFGETPLHWAVNYNNFDIIKLLIDKCNKEYEAVVIEIIARNKLDIHNNRSSLNLELEKAQELHPSKLINAKDNHEGTPLTSSVSQGNYAIIKLLIDSGANVNLPGQSGITALHEAAISKDENIIKMLLSKGADVNIKPDYNISALHLAAMNNSYKIAKLLLQAGADKNMLDNNGKRAVDVTANRAIKNLINTFDYDKYKAHRLRPLVGQIIDYINKNRLLFAEDLIELLPPDLLAQIKNPKID